MHEPEVAIVFTPEIWVEELHRYFTDHGGARVRQLVVDPALAVSEQYSVLIVSWRWPSLTRGLVAQLHEQGRRVLGVGDSLEPASTEFLQSVNVDLVVSCDAAHHEFLEALLLLQADPIADAIFGTRSTTASAPASRAPLIAVGGPFGSGKTEVAIEFARALPALLVDCDEIAPSIAPRLAVGIEPNLRTAIDAVEFGLGVLDDSTTLADAQRIAVVSGLPNVSTWSQIRATEVVRTVRAFQSSGPVVVDTSSSLDEVGHATRSRYAVTRALMMEADAICVVARSTPVGAVRLLSWIADLQMLRPGAPVHVVMNLAPTERARVRELVAEICRSFEPLSITAVPCDRRVDLAGWAGSCVRRGPFTKAAGHALNKIVAQLPMDLDGIDRAERAPDAVEDLSGVVPRGALVSAPGVSL